MKNITLKRAVLAVIILIIGLITVFVVFQFNKKDEVSEELTIVEISDSTDTETLATIEYLNKIEDSDLYKSLLQFNDVEHGIKFSYPSFFGEFVLDTNTTNEYTADYNDDWFPRLEYSTYPLENYEVAIRDKGVYVYSHNNWYVREFKDWNEELLSGKLASMEKDLSMVIMYPGYEVNPWRLLIPIPEKNIILSIHSSTSGIVNTAINYNVLSLFKIIKDSVEVK